MMWRLARTEGLSPLQVCTGFLTPWCSLFGQCPVIPIRLPEPQKLVGRDFTAHGASAAPTTQR